jgi:thiol:disulfide interchange protein DsbC
MSGQIMATSSKENLTQARLSALTRVDFGSLPLASAIKVVKGTGSRTLVVFADPNCPYCRQLEEELQGVSDVTVYTFLFPLEELHPGARAHAEAIWCSKDPAQAWSQWMLKHVEPQAASCPTDALAALEKLGVKLNVIGTPTLIFGDGRRISGLIPQAQLEQELSRISPNKG